MKDGIFTRLRTRLFGETDPVDEQLADIAHQGSGMARIAHGAAFLLIILFSAGSLVALSGDALARIAAAGIQPSTVPAIISTAVSTLLVTCMDVALIYAASMLRILNARRADSEEKSIHIAVLICASLLESGTYIYMAYQYDRPATLAAWILVVARAMAAPLFSVYLSMARTLPIGPRDILYHVELSTGRGVIRDAVKIANDESAPLARKMQLYSASAVMMEADRARLERMIETMKDRREPASLHELTSNASPVLPAIAAPSNPEPPTEPEPPEPRTPAQDEATAPADSAAEMMRSNVRVLTPFPVPTQKRTSVRATRTDAGRSRQVADQLRERRVEIAREILTANKDTGVRELTRKIALATKRRISTSTAATIRADVLAELAQPERAAMDEVMDG